jgi:MFS family permease
VKHSDAYRRYVLGALTLVYALHYTDRALINLLLQPIKEDLHLSDTSLGFLSGIAFGLFYATLGVPVARLADRGNRVTITSIAIALWGVTVMSCMFVVNFAQLVAARVAAAVGEAGCMPPTYSLLGDYFPRAVERTRAMTLYWLGSPIAALVSFVAGGWINDRYGWRVAFLVIGLPAIFIAVLVKLTIVEPRAAATANPISRPLPPMSEVLRLLWRQHTTRHLTIAIVLLLTLGMGMNPWYAAFMVRSHGMSTADLGVWLGIIFGGGGIAGILLGGYVATRWFASDEARQLRASAVSVGLLLPCFVLFLTLPERHQALCALVPLVTVFNFFIAPAFALLQRLVADEMRATTLAVVMLLANLIGMGGGPQIVGLLSDALRPALGSASLRYAMLAMSLIALWATYHFWQAASAVNQNLRR